MKKLLVNYSEVFPGLEKKPHSYQVLADNFEWENRDVVRHGVERRYDEFQTFLSDHIGQESGKLIVECGCGLGANLLRFKEKNLCLGVDFSRVALNKVHSFTNKIKVAQGDGARLPVRSNCADYVILARVLFVHEDLHVIETMVEEAERILKPGGKVIIVNDYCNWGIEISRSVSELLNRVVKMFEPYAGLWQTAFDWTTSYANWVEGPFVDLDAEIILFLSTSSFDNNFVASTFLSIFFFI